MAPHPGPGRLRVGCAMWAHRAWVGRQFPIGTRPGDELAEYVTWCTAVEGNTTFYALPPLETVRRWAATAPDSFRFLFKLPRSITHDQRLRGTDAELVAFLRLLEPLGDRLGPFSIQLPASFGPGDLGVLAAFVRRLPDAVRWSVEVRHPDFFDGGRAAAHLDHLLADRGIERIIMDTTTLFGAPPTDAAEREAWTQKPRVPVRRVALTDTPIVRCIGRTDPADTVAGWQPWVPIVVAWLAEGRTPTVFVHTPDNIDALWLARCFHDDVRVAAGEASIALEPLPEPHPTIPSMVQERLFD